MGGPVLRDNALTTLAALKPLLGLADDDSSNDGLLIQLINQASAFVESALGRKLKRATYTECAKGTGNQLLLVENYPIVDVDYIKQAGEIISPVLYDYTMRGSAGVIYKDDGWTYYGYPYGLTHDYVTGSRNVEIRYTAGYILPKDGTDEEPCDMPADLESLVQEMIQRSFGKLQSGGAAGLKSFAISDVRWEWQNDAPHTWQEIINQHRRVWV